MVDVSVDILNYDLPERSDSSIIFQVNTPWVQEHRLWMNENLRTYETKNKLLPTWEVSKFVKFLNTKSSGPGQGQVALFIEFRYSNAPVDNLKNPGTIEEFGGMSGMINLYDIIFGRGPNPIIKELEVINVLENKRVGRINTRINCTIWPLLRELLFNLPRTASVPSLQFQDPILSDCKDLPLPSSSSKQNWNSSSQRTAEDKRIILGHNAAVVSLEDSVETSNVFDAPIDPDDDALGDTEKCILPLEQQHRIPSAIPKRLLPTAGAPRTPDRVRALRDSMFEEPSFGSPQMFGNTPEVVRIRRKYRSFSSTNPPTQPLSPTSFANTQTRVRERLRSHTDSYDDPERDVPSESSYLLFESSMENPKDPNNPPNATDGNNNQSHAGTSDHVGNTKGSYEVAHKDVEKITIQVPANTS